MMNHSAIRRTRSNRHITSRIIRVRHANPLRTLNMRPMRLNRGFLQLHLNDEDRYLIISRFILRHKSLINRPTQAMLTQVRVRVLASIHSRAATIINIMSKGKAQRPRIINLPTRSTRANAIRNQRPRPLPSQASNNNSPFLRLNHNLINRNSNRSLQERNLTNNRRVPSTSNRRPNLTQADTHRRGSKTTAVHSYYYLLEIRVERWIIR